MLRTALPDVLRMLAFDHAFSGLIADLDQRGLLDSTLVAR